jgi:hypothetical protein
MQISFGPRSDTYKAYAMNGRPTEPGAAGAVTGVGAFYDMTRARCFPGTFSAISFFAPLIVFVATIGVFLWLVSPLKLLPEGPPIAAKASDPSLPVDKFCDPGKGFDPLLNSVLANTFHFSVTHVALFVICALAFLAAAASLRNVVQIHIFPNAEGFWKFLVWALSFVIPAGLGYGVFWVSSWFIGDRVDALFQRLFPIPSAALDRCQVLKDLGGLKQQLYGQMSLGAAAVSVAVMSLILAAALLGWRFERKQPNEAWSDTYVLRHKINTVLTLFFIGSALLVVTTIALSSATNWVGAVLDTIAAATTTDGGATDAKAGAADAGQSVTDTTPSAPKTPTNPPAATEKQASPKSFDPVAAEFESLKTLKASISTFAGAAGSLLVILIFVPALYCLTGEIEMAGKTHASADAAQTSPPPATPGTAPVLAKTSSGAVFEVQVAPGAGARPILSVKDQRGNLVDTLELVAAPGAPPSWSFIGRREGNTYEFMIPRPSAETPDTAELWKVAGWKTVQDWKERHGLKLSFTDLTATFVAVLAPLLSGSVIDLTKMMLG